MPCVSLLRSYGYVAYSVMDADSYFDGHIGTDMSPSYVEDSDPMPCGSAMCC